MPPAPLAALVRPAALAALALLAAAPLPRAQGPQDLAAVEVRVVAVADGVSMLVGAGGNIGLSTGEDGAILIDDQFAPLTERILAAVATVTDRPVRFVVNTHWHFDHTGGNENLGGAGAVIVAHDNVRVRMSVEQVMETIGRTFPASPAEALPVITFTDRVTFHWNGDDIEVIHVPAAHTDGDALIRFTRANVLHLGDCYFAGAYPLVDTSSGGSLDGLVAAIDRALELCDDETRIIPGHGELSDRAELAAWREMLATVAGRLHRHAEAGHDVRQVIEAAPTAEFDVRYGGGFISSERFVIITYEGLLADRARAAR